MRKFLLFLTFCPAFFYGQVFQENFDGNGPGFTAWTVIDVDGQTPADAVSYITTGWNRIDKDGPDGSFGGPAGDHAAMSTSWYETPGTSNDWLISPQIDLAGLTTAFIQWDSKAQDADFPDGYVLKLAPNGGNTVADFTVDLFSTIAENPTYTSRMADLTAYVGQTVRIAFVNNSTDKFILIVDNIVVTEEEPVIPITYCTVDFFVAEAITLVEVADLNNPTPPSNSEIYIDYTSMVVNMTAGESYPIALEGFTDGNFENFFSVFIDWNQNGNFDDAGESYEIGSITNSTGTDGIQATGTIAVPADALAGNTRMRVIKNYDESPTDGCFVDAFFGQTQDYTVAVASLATPTFDSATFALYPNPASELITLRYKNPIDQVVIYNFLGAEVARYSSSATEVSLNVETLSTGVYVVKVQSAGAVKTVKMIKQ
ncbi:MAG: choice-of-anchor J domain-containing protein [Flavobacterium sp.]|nr:choice-of-anchor J domain-containing protein [Flavobacterium sp.]